MKSLAEPLQEYLAGRFEGASLAQFEFIASGFESDVYAFCLHLPKQLAQPLILRLYPGEGASQKMVREGQGLLHLRQACFPAPALFLYETDASILGQPFTIIERLEGRSLWPVLAAADPARTVELLDQFASLLARLHRLDWRPFTPQAALYEADPAMVMKELYASFRQLYTQFEVGGFLPILDWLEDHLYQIPLRLAVVHLDFHANNVFLCSDGSLAGIDWTQITVADYRLDLTWTLMIMGDYGQPEWSERILQAYRRTAGWSVEQLDYFNVLTYTKLLASRVISLKTDPTRLGLRPETAESLQQQAPVLKSLAERIWKITELRVPEVEAVISPP